MRQPACVVKETCAKAVSGANAGKISIYTGFIATHVIVDVVAYIQ